MRCLIVCCLLNLIEFGVWSMWLTFDVGVEFCVLRACGWIYGDNDSTHLMIRMVVTQR